MVLQTLGKGKAEGWEGRVDTKPASASFLGDWAGQGHQGAIGNTLQTLLLPPCMVGQGVERHNVAVV